ncbi:hypothetical protein E306M_07150 [Moorella sp. E306M]|nr:hypothetical protein E306M_07150 [Moorella sp. E306M]
MLADGWGERIIPCALNLKRGTKYYPVETVGDIYVLGEVDKNKKCLEFLSQKEILLHFFDYYGYYVGSFYPREHYNSGHMILRQAEHYLDGEKRLWLARQFVLGAVSNIRQVLHYYYKRGKNLREIIDAIEPRETKVPSCGSIVELMAIEGNIREY